MGQADVDMAEGSSTDVFGPDISIPPTPAPEEPEDDPMNATSDITAAPESAQSLPNDNPRKPLAWPQLRYLPNAASTPPTYIQPPSVRPTTATASIGGKVTPISTGGSKIAGEGEAKGRKKKKASGLAKLLAQSKEREEGIMGGKWGFG